MRPKNLLQSTFASALCLLLTAGNLHAADEKKAEDKPKTEEAAKPADDKKAADAAKPADTAKPAEATAEVKPKVIPKGFPADATFDVSKANGTTFPLPTTDSAELKMGEHPRDLSKWISRSHLDERAVPEPKKVTLEGDLNGNVENGKKIAMDTAKGNCWACHALPGDDQPGNNGPSLLQIGARGMTDAELYQIVYDRRVLNPTTAMPPYGTLETLADQDIRDIVAFLQTLK